MIRGESGFLDLFEPQVCDAEEFVRLMQVVAIDAPYWHDYTFGKGGNRALTQEVQKVLMNNGLVNKKGKMR